MRVRLTFCKSSAIINLINNIRFQGDNYHYGLTVKGSDKTAIKEVLESCKQKSIAEMKKVPQNLRDRKRA